MLNQLICIQTRYVGMIADGCLLDGLVGIHIFLSTPTGHIPSQPMMLAPGGTVAQLRLGNFLQWIKRSHLQRYWLSLSGCLQLQQG
ncbi:MAG: hypothetical protein AAGH78_04165 [Cyanobacteria bacterium P01_H01_bin.58]